MKFQLLHVLQREPKEFVPPYRYQCLCSTMNKRYVGTFASRLTSTVVVYTCILLTEIIVLWFLNIIISLSYTTVDYVCTV